MFELVDVVLVEVNSEGIIKSFFKWLFVLMGYTYSIFIAIDLSVVVSVVNPIKNSSETFWINIEPS